VKLLLDTLALIWWMSDDERIGPQARALIADPGNDVLISVVSLWEIVVKLRVGKLEADIQEIAGACESSGFIPLDVRLDHLRQLATLPMHHRDPFDHLLIAQAITEGAALVTDDRHAARYPVQAVACTA
jgi:PIN domain nuclease of toxin-antitoxin system